MTTEELADWIERNAQWEFTRSGGPGGQNVNKVNTRAVLRLPVDRLPVDEAALRQVRDRLGSRISNDGELMIRSSEARSQLVNRRNAVDRAISLLSAALRPRKRRRPTRPTHGARERRIAEKKRRGERKQARRPPQPD